MFYVIIILEKVNSFVGFVPIMSPILAVQVLFRYISCRSNIEQVTKLFSRI